MNHFPPSKLGCVALMLSVCLAACKRTQTDVLLEPSQALGDLLAEETVRAAGANKTIALILPDSQWGSASTVETAFKSALKSKGYSILVAKTAHLGDPMFMAKAGLRADDFFEAVQNAGNAGAIVSLAGAPVLTPAETSKLPPGHPAILVVATASLGNEPGLPGVRAQLESLIAANIIQLAIVNGAEPGAASSGKIDSARVLFDQNYRILRSAR